MATLLSSQYLIVEACVQTKHELWHYSFFYAVCTGSPVIRVSLNKPHTNRLMVRTSQQLQENTDLLMLHIKLVRMYFLFFVHCPNDDTAELLCRHHRELRLQMEKETPEEAELRRACKKKGT